jgi:hypothetical protein
LEEELALVGVRGEVAAGRPECEQDGGDRGSDDGCGQRVPVQPGQGWEPGGDSRDRTARREPP